MNNYQRTKIDEIVNLRNSKKNVQIKSSGKGLLHQKVFHQKFGYGIVTKLQENKATVNFSKAGIKTIIQDFLQEA